MYAKTHSTLMIKNFAESSTIHENDKLFIIDLQIDYQQITESFLYIIIQTHSNLATAFLKLAQFNVKAIFFHFKAQIRTLQYVRNMLDYSIIYSDDSDLAIYSDIDY